MDRRLLAGIRGCVDRGPGGQQMLQTIHLREENSSGTPLASVPRSPGNENLSTLPTLKRLDSAAPSGKSPSLALPSRQTYRNSSLQDKRGPTLTSELQSSNSISWLTRRTGVTGVQRWGTRGRRQERVPSADNYSGIKTATPRSRPRPTSGRAPAA